MNDICPCASQRRRDAQAADIKYTGYVGQIKIGSIARSERLAKYNQRLRIEEQMGPGAPFAKWEPIS